MTSGLQEHHDRYYMKHGKCCAGCDYWRPFNGYIGECIKTVPVSGEEKVSMMGMHSITIKIDAGHIWTPIDHVCGEFIDTFDWASLPLGYLVRIGAVNNVHDIKVSND